MARQRLFEYPFEFREYIEHRLLEFDDLEERRFAKAILRDGLLRIIDETEKKYSALEKRVYDEIACDASRCVIRTTIVRRRYFDAASADWFPVADGAARPFLVSGGELWAAAARGEPIDLTHVYIEAPDAKCAELLDGRAEFSGYLQTDRGEVAARFCLRKSGIYREKISELYDLFLANRIPWTTLNTAYIDKCFALTLLRLEDEAPEEAEWTGLNVDYGAYGSIVAEDILPLWNIQTIQFDGTPFPIPCVDGVNYEHVFPLREFGAEYGYLIAPRAQIADIRHEAGQLIVVTNRETFTGWRALKIAARPFSLPVGYDAPVLSNAAGGSFIRSYLQETGAALKTKADLYRRVRELDIGAFLRFQGFELLDTAPEETALEDMNWFIQDELFDRRSRRILLLIFDALAPDHYLNDAMARFAASSIQYLESEYRCVWKISDRTGGR